jgi:hypothetical protein
MPELLIFSTFPSLSFTQLALFAWAGAKPGAIARRPTKPDNLFRNPGQVTPHANAARSRTSGSAASFVVD